MRRSISDLAIILARSDYGEKDRILTVLTPAHGKLRAIARGVRSSKSRLAGGIELFAENELALAEGRGSLYTITFSRMKRYFGDISKDLDSSMYAYDCLKLANKLTPDNAGGEYYSILVTLLESLAEHKVPLTQIRMWCSLKILEELGASPNFASNIKANGQAGQGSYEYDFDKQSFFEKIGGPYSPDHIKLLRYIQKLAKPKEIKIENQGIIDKADNLVRLIFLNQTG